VLQVVLSLNPGGTERLVIELTRRLHARVPMAVCCLDEPGRWAPELRDIGVPVHALTRSAGFHPSLGGSIARLAAQHRATLVHCHHYSPFVYGALARLWRPRLSVVFTEHGRLSDAKPSGRRRLANQLLGRVPDAVYAVSSELGQHLIAEGLPASLVGVIYNGIDIGPVPTADARRRVRQQLGMNDDALVVGTIARLDPVKDLGTLIRAVAAIEGTPVQLVVIGDGPERAALESQALAGAEPGRIRFLGQRDDARDWLAGCDVYVNSSISEGVSLTILEAMAASLPVVATRVGGTPEVVDEASGVLVEARSREAITLALGALAGDPARRRRLGAAARERVEAKFSLSRMVREYHDVYRRFS
jgi:glycosyltransferase involved in cell wall biosynthesis